MTLLTVTIVMLAVAVIGAIAVCPHLYTVLGFQAQPRGQTIDPHPSLFRPRPIVVIVGAQIEIDARITSYNVCYTKLLRTGS